MSDIDIVKRFETVGFTRGQAEMQVRTISDFKKDLMTKEDASYLNRRMDHIEQRMDHIEQRIDHIEKRLDHIIARIDEMPERIAIHVSKVMITIVSIYPLWLLIKKILTWLRIL